MTDDPVAIAQTHPDHLPDYPMARAAQCPFAPPPALLALQDGTPITRVRLGDGSTPWLVTGYDRIRTLLADPRISSDVTRPHFPFQTPAQSERERRAPTFINMDDPEHARRRRMVTASFAIKRVEALRPVVQNIVDGLIDTMLAGERPVDLVEAFALPVPSLVICELLGVPYADHGFFQARSRLLVKRDVPPQDALAADRELIDYLDRLITEKLAAPGDDLLSKLAVEQVATGAISQRELAATGRLLLTAGHETTANMIALGTLALLEHPDQLAELREADGPGLVAGAVEELLRYLTIVHTGRRRTALADIEIDGQVIHAGEPVLLANDAGDWDAAAFAEPDRLDIHRDAGHHVAFGFGVHQCLGQPLARVELQAVYGTLYRRIPTLRLAVDRERIPFKHDGFVYGVYQLPVTWGTSQAARSPDREAARSVSFGRERNKQQAAAAVDPDKETVMRVTVDQDKCVASGQCVLATAEVFDQRDEDGVVVLLNAGPPAELADAVRKAAAVCPARAIWVDGA